MHNNCGCNQTPVTPCAPSISIPMDVQPLQGGGPCPQNPNSPQAASFYVAPNGFVVPAVGSSSPLIVNDGSFFAAGQWIQFINPAGTFRILAVAGNVLTLQNSAADGVTPILGNPVPPFQYAPNAPFITVGQPNQATSQQFTQLVQQAVSELDSACFSSVPQKSDTEQVYLMGYVKSSVCGEETESGACLRRMQSDGPYIDEDGKTIFQQPISAPSIEIPVPEGGIPSSNTTPINPNGGTGGGYLVAFINPTTGATTYIDLTSGKANGTVYGIYLNPTGQISLIDGMNKHETFWPDFVVHSAGAGSYGGFAPTNIDIAQFTGQPVPAWARYVEVRLNCVLINTGGVDSIRFLLNDVEALARAITDGTRSSIEEIFRIPITNGQFKLEIRTFTNSAGTTPGNTTFASLGLGSGSVRVSIIGLVS